MMKRHAFTMIELIFVIVVLGILASVAIPKMGSIMNSSMVASAQGDVSAIRASISRARQEQVLKGGNGYITKLTTAAAVTDGTPMFDGNGSITLLTYPIYAKQKAGWYRTAANVYTFSIDGSAANTATFTYTPANGRFDCTHTESLCKKIVE